MFPGETHMPGLPRHSSGRRNNWLVMAFGMPETELSRRGAGGKCWKHGQLDILAFGMPKI